MRHLSRVLSSVVTLSLGLSACGGDSGGGGVTESDNTSPSVTITQPAQGAVGDFFSIVAEASDNVGVTGVRFLINGVVLGPDDTEPPYQQSWDASVAMSGAIQLTAIARDAAGNEGTSPPVQVSIVHTSSGTVTVVVEGTGEDPDGYSVLLDGVAAATIGPGTNATRFSVPPGSHQFELGDVDASCTVSGDAIQTVEIVAGSETSLFFTVNCGG
jgi:Big-like domain-containing protein